MPRRANTQRRCTDCQKHWARYNNGLCRSCNTARARESRRRNAGNPCVDCGEPRNSYSNRCTPCIVEKQRRWIKENPEKAARHMRNANLKRAYGITLDEYEKMVHRQGGKCAICRDAPKEKLQVDHCHTTGKRRGLLCRRCNLMLGYMEADGAALQRALAYIGK